MVPVELARIIIDERNPEQVVVLKEKNGRRQVPIVIGFVEATSIQMRIAGSEPERPMTHDLLASVLRALGAEVECLVIDDLVEGTFFAKLRMQHTANGTVAVDCRPSDGIALAVRLAIPMFVDERVFQKAGASQ